MKKKIPRIFIDMPLKINQNIFLYEKKYHYIKHVLRIKNKEILEIFNNTDYIFFAKIIDIQNKKILITIFDKIFKNIESPLQIHLGQVISQSNHMNFTIQKSVELGVSVITPLFYELHNIQNNYLYNQKKNIHWKNIAISACQQCQRNIIPIINKPMLMEDWCRQYQDNEIRIVLNPKSLLKMKNLPKSIKKIRILIGSEIGLSKDKIKKIIQHDFFSISLGSRILRTETAGIVSIAILQEKFGDL